MDKFQILQLLVFPDGGSSVEGYRDIRINLQNFLGKKWLLLVHDRLLAIIILKVKLLSWLMIFFADVWNCTVLKEIRTLIVELETCVKFLILVDSLTELAYSDIVIVLQQLHMKISCFSS